MSGSHVSAPHDSLNDIDKDYIHENVSCDDAGNTIHDDIVSFGHCISQQNQYFIEWEMTVRHPKLNKGEAILVPGATLFKVDEQEKIIFHRDYFDAGVMLYEHIPLLGRLIKWVKGRI